MHHIPGSGIFAMRKQKKSTDQSPSSKPRLVRSNAVKDFDYTPSHTPSYPSSVGCLSWSPDTTHSWERTSLRIDETAGDVDLICLGFSGPEEFEIPLDVWAEMKTRESADVPKWPQLNLWDSEKLEESQELKVDRVVDELCYGFEDRVQISDMVGPSHRGSGSGGSNGIRGDRPPLLTPPAMSLPVVCSGCFSCDLVEPLASDANEPALQGHVVLHFSHENDGCEAAGANVDQVGLNRVRLWEALGSCSFTTSQDDDSSSVTTDPVSVISPNGVVRADITGWQKGELLGQGSFGMVYKAISSEGFFFAVKEVSLLEQGSQGKQSVLQLEQEIDLLSQFEHENIVRYLGTRKDDSKLYIFLELITQGSLVSLYKTFHLQDPLVSAYTRQILLGLKYLHDMNVVHRDIKCANILVATNGTVKLADFGLAKTTKFNDLKSCKGTALWMAPEVVNQKNQGYGLKADIWSLGCTVLEMLTRNVPYHPLEFMTALFRIGNGTLPSVPDSLSKDARDFILQCLRVDPNDRPTAAELLHHPFVKRPLPTGSESPMFIAAC